MVELGLGEVALLAGAGFLAGAVNAVAGGGSLISFPALLAVGYPSVTANVTNSVAVLPGYLGGSLGYRRELRGQRGRAVALAVTSAAGAAAGAALLLLGSEQTFERIVPFLILFSCALLAAQPAISRMVRRPERENSLRLHVMEFAAAVYGGYFGAGLGIMLLAVLALSIEDELQRLNALKGLLSMLIGAVAALSFAIFGPVEWGAAGIMAGTSLLGGQAGVIAARRLPEGVLRAVVVVFGVAVAVVLLA
ncbi:MAG TPA: sulfite exporter TauE/SafE family protein [Thermoleophilaceae bacterium]|nr:sulfite exporter TauE/SafE family protein [Thermoleophilaceae bacterium]